MRDFGPDRDEPTVPTRPDDRDQCFAIEFGHGTLSHQKHFYGTPDEMLIYIKLKARPQISTDINT
jgi:hypothetical protein